MREMECGDGADENSQNKLWAPLKIETPKFLAPIGWICSSAFPAEQV
jgi:hypothetical protein